MAETQWMTLLETADMMKRMPDQVTRMCVEGKLEYYLEDGRYFVSRESIDLFMHSGTGEPAPESPDSNGTPRRQYGRAPAHTEPLTESAHETATVYGRDEAATAEAADATGVASETNGGIADEMPGEVEDSVARDDTATAETTDVAGMETRADFVDEAPGQDDEDLHTRKADETDSFSRAAATAGQDTPDVSAGLTDESKPEYGSAPDTSKGYAEEGLASSEEDEDGATEEDAVARVDEVDASARVDEVDTVTRVDEVDKVDEVDASAGEDEEQASSMMEPVDPGTKVVEVLADLRAALARHALEHKAFCDEIAGLADALESTLSRDDDKTSELTREISSLLARYTRR